MFDVGAYEQFIRYLVTDIDLAGMVRAADEVGIRSVFPAAANCGHLTVYIRIERFDGQFVDRADGGFYFHTFIFLLVVIDVFVVDVGDLVFDVPAEAYHAEVELIVEQEGLYPCFIAYGMFSLQVFIAIDAVEGCKGGCFKTGGYTGKHLEFVGEYVRGVDGVGELVAVLIVDSIAASQFKVEAGEVFQEERRIRADGGLLMRTVLHIFEIRGVGQFGFTVFSTCQYLEPAGYIVVGVKFAEVSAAVGVGFTPGSFIVAGYFLVSEITEDGAFLQVVLSAHAGMECIGSVPVEHGVYKRTAIEAAFIIAVKQERLDTEVFGSLDAYGGVEAVGFITVAVVICLAGSIVCFGDTIGSEVGEADIVIYIILLATEANGAFHATVGTVYEVAININGFNAAFFSDDVDDTRNSIGSVQGGLRTTEDLDALYLVDGEEAEIDSVAGEAGSICNGDAVHKDGGVLGGGAAEVNFAVFAGVRVSAADHDAGLLVEHIGYGAADVLFDSTGGDDGEYFARFALFLVEFSSGNHNSVELGNPGRVLRLGGDTGAKDAGCQDQVCFFHVGHRL